MESKARAEAQPQRPNPNDPVPTTVADQSSQISTRRFFSFSLDPVPAAMGVESPAPDAIIRFPSMPLAFSSVTTDCARAYERALLSGYLAFDFFGGSESVWPTTKNF